jgi:hypothetical protein
MAAMPAPGAGVPPATTASAPTTEEPQNLNSRLNTVDRYWKFKGALQVVAIITGLIGIGAIGWCVSSKPRTIFAYGYDEFFSQWPMLITFAVSVVWCITCILVLVLRKRPVHPGLRVTMELFLWLGFIVTALFAVAAYLDLVSWGAGGDLGYGYSTSYGDYELAANGTWVWEDRSDSLSYTRNCNGTSSRYYYYEDVPATFKDCAEQDAYINKLWQEKQHRTGVVLTGVVCQFFGLVIHFALFVWACVDCHRHRRSKVTKDAEKLAANIVQTMISNGAVLPPPGQAHFRPGPQWGTQGMGYYQLPPQGQQAYPMANMYPQSMPAAQRASHQYAAPQGMMSGANGPAAGPSNEKSEGPRYA